MKKIFILTGEPSGDKLASTVISKLKSQNIEIEYLSVGGNHLKKLGINSIFNLSEITIWVLQVFYLIYLKSEIKLIKLLMKLLSLILIYYFLLIVLILLCVLLKE